MMIPVKEFEDLYSICPNTLKVYSIKRNSPLRMTVNNAGYLKVNMYKNNKQYSRDIHRLLAIHFIPNPDNLPVVDHIDRNRMNNNLDNLRWTSRSINSHNCESKGYSYCNREKKWRAYITIGGIYKSLGYFDTEEEAITARNASKTLVLPTLEEEITG